MFNTIADIISYILSTTHIIDQVPHHAVPFPVGVLSPIVAVLHQIELHLKEQIFLQLIDQVHNVALVHGAVVSLSLAGCRLPNKRFLLQTESQMT